MTLRLSLIATIGLAMGLTLLVGSIVMYARAFNKVETEVNAAMKLAQRNAEDTVQHYASRLEALRRLPRLISSFEGHRFVRATFQGHVKETFAKSEIQRSKAHAPAWFASLFSETGNHIVVALPDPIGDIGQLSLTSDPYNEVEEVWAYLTDALMVLTALCLSVLLLIYLQLSHSLRPLEVLSRAFAEVGPERRPAPVPEHGPRELLQVYQGFNQMIDGLSRAEEKNRRLNQQLTAVQEEERADLARDLHDEIGPFLFAVDVDASSVKQLPVISNNEDAIKRIDSIRSSVKHMQGIVKSLLGRLRPGVLLDLGLAPAVENLVDFWHGRHSDITIKTELPEDDLGEPFNSTIYRVIQESLSNAIRHGNPTHINVSVALRDDNNVHVSIIDNGGGCDHIERTVSPGFGIRGMRERVQSMGGTFTVINQQDIKKTKPGIRVEAVLPASSAAEAAAVLESHKQTTKDKTSVGVE